MDTLIPQNQKPTSDLLLKLTLIFLIFGLSGSYGIHLGKLRNPSPVTSPQTVTPQEVSQDVMGARVNPQIYFYGDAKISNGAIIGLASTDESAIDIGGYKILGELTIDIYEASATVLLDYLVYGEAGNQLNKSIDTTTLHHVTTVTHTLNLASSYEDRVPLPLEGTGIWYLKLSVGETTAHAFIVRSGTGVIVKEGDNKFIFWGQDFTTKRSVSDGTIHIYNLENGKKILETLEFNSEGIAKARLSAQADVALVYRDDDVALLPINLTHLSSYRFYTSFNRKSVATKYFVFTDRPLYKPGDTVYFKTILRDDDDARYTIPSGEVTVSIYDGYRYGDAKPVFEKNYSISSAGTIDGYYQLSDKAKIGYYTLVVSMPNADSDDPWAREDTTSFDVEYFRKPEFTIDVSVPSTDLVSGDHSSFTITGNYFSGQPLANQLVEYRVRAVNFHDYTYLSDAQRHSFGNPYSYRFWFWYGNTSVTEGSATLDQYGKATISMPTTVSATPGKPQIYTISANSSGSSYDSKNILVFPGEFGIYRREGNYRGTVDSKFELPITLLPYRANTNIANVPLTASVKRYYWSSYWKEGAKYSSYKREEESLSQLTATTDAQGNTTLAFTPTQPGSYDITVEAQDKQGNKIVKTFYTYVSSKDQPFYSADTTAVDITLAPDKQTYEPTDTIKLDIFSTIPDRDILLTFERGRVQRFQVVKLSGASDTVSLPLTSTDIPNVYIRASSFSDYALDTEQLNLSVGADTKKIKVAITPDSASYGPGETTQINIATTDLAGNPVAADVTLWAVDQAIFELSDSKLGDIFEAFWKSRYNTTTSSHSLSGISIGSAAEGGGGCFAKGTQVLMANGSLRAIDTVKVGDYVLTRSEHDSTLKKARVTATHSAEETGYLIINGNLKVTADHIIWLNGQWQTAGSSQLGDVLVDSANNQVPITSLEWQRGKFTVYNLTVEDYHAYFAGGAWVHNQKGGSRSVFKDTAYWNPLVKTDKNGKAKVSFKFPDNLTTWVVAAVAVTPSTQVGQTTETIVVTKDLIIRPILPNILRVGDNLLLTALVQNFTPKEQPLDVKLTFDAGEVAQEVISDLVLSTNQTHQLEWQVTPTQANEAAQVTFDATSSKDEDLADIVTHTLPVIPFGFEEQSSQFTEGTTTYRVKLHPDSDQARSSVTLSLASTLVGTLPSAMEYLIDYPYGCIEQTTSRFVPAVIAKQNPALFSKVLAEKDVDAMIEKGIARLTALQSGNGSWNWGYSGNSNAFITAYVLEYVLQARQAGIEVDDELLWKAGNYLENHLATTGEPKEFPREELIVKNYALMLLGARDKVVAVPDLAGLTPDILSLAVMTNYMNGDHNSVTNGLSLLIGMAKDQGDSVYWENGPKTNFGSKDASTALAVRAILMAEGDREVAAKAVRYLMRNRVARYWSNSYATAQVVRAIVEFAKTGNELTPDYAYSVALDGKNIAQGNVTSSSPDPITVDVPVADILAEGSSLTITKEGDGQLYSTYMQTDFRTDRGAQPVTNGLYITREYINEKGNHYTLGVGDTVLVTLKVGGLANTEVYGVIEDELPAGLVPVNETFLNEVDNRSSPSYSYYGRYDREYTQNGAILTLYRIDPGEQTYVYKARVVSEGTFTVPPAAVSLMYSPEINGRSAVQTVQTDKVSAVVPGKLPTGFARYHQTGRLGIAQLGSSVLVGILVWLAIFYVKNRRLPFKRNEDH